MMAQVIDRGLLKKKMKSLLRGAQVSPRRMTALYLSLVMVLNLADFFTSSMEVPLLGTFVTILTYLLVFTLSSGYTMYCMAIRRGERAEYLTLFDGFSFVGKIILLNIVQFFFVFLWSMLFVIPGLIAGYRYRFALLNLYENPGIGVMEALDMSKRQTVGYKSQLLTLDMTYAGWYLLTILPSLVELIYIYVTVLLDLELYMADPYQIYAITLPFSPWLVFLVSSLWMLAVQLFYLPVYHTTFLGYFEIAKQTSGVSSTPQNSQNQLGDGGWHSDF